MSGPTYVVMGGAGRMGRITVRDLVETAPGAEVVIADHDIAAADALAASYRSPHVRARGVDVRDVDGTARTLAGAFAVLNCVQHRFNLPVMRACLAAGCHYLDLGGLFHVTRQQLALHDEFLSRSLLALLGMGAAPGIVNVLARKGADALERVHEIHVYVAGVDRTPGRRPPLLGASYTMETIAEEACAPAARFTEGRFEFVEAMSGAEEVVFPQPVGLARPSYTLHSEVATLPLSFADKGVREVSFRIAFSHELDERLRFLKGLGLLSPEPVTVDGVAVVPRRLLMRLLEALPPGEAGGPPDEHEVLRVVLFGESGGLPQERVLDCHVPGIPAWEMGVDVDTGCPPSICAQLLHEGVITARGCRPPEQAVPVAPFLAALARRGMTVTEVVR